MLVRKSVLVALASLGLVPAMWGANLGHPGIVNYVEGHVAINGQPISAKSVGSEDVGAGQVLETQHGKAEVLLTPGVFLRVGDNAAIRMDNPGLTDTRVSVLHGEALFEVTELHSQNHLVVSDAGASAELVKKGLYDFNADQPRLAVYDGEAKVHEGDSETTVKKGKELFLASAALKAQKFDRKATDDLYSWSSVRSQYLAEASAQSAGTYFVNTAGWYGPGWYWNPWFGMYSFIPGGGLLYSPFGWGFYSPAYIGYYGPVVYRYPHHYVGGGRPSSPVTRSAPAVHSGFRSAPAMGGTRGFRR